MLWQANQPRVAVLAAILVLVNPWIFENSQNARFYTLTLWLTSLATLALYRWTSQPRNRLLVLFVLAATLATLTHTTAFLVFAGGIAGVVAQTLFSGRPGFSFRLDKSLVAFAVCAVVCASIVMATAYWSFSGWSSARFGNFGNYSATSMVGAFCIFAGIPVLALAFVPMVRNPRTWTADEVFLATMFLAMTLPILFLVGMGGGVAPRYLFGALPCLIVLAARHWQGVMERVKRPEIAAAVSVAMLGFYLPYFASTLMDGNHHDYRGAVRFVESLELINPIVVVSADKTYLHYMRSDYQVEELGVFENMNGGQTKEKSSTGRSILKWTALAESTGRPLILVSWEGRTPIEAGVWQWVGSQFGLINVIETPRFDHRRNRLSIYRRFAQPAREYGEQ